MDLLMSYQGFVYRLARFSADHKSIEITVRPRKGTRAICSCCQQPATGYDQLIERRFELIANYHPRLSA